MPRHCSAGGCKSRDNRETRNAGVTFHKLPKGATRRNLWITNSHRSNSWDPQTDFVYFCSKHFTPESFELTNYSGIRRLKEDAMPTVFNTSTTKEQKTADALHKQADKLVSFSSGSQAQAQVQHSEENTSQWSVPTSEKILDTQQKFLPQEPAPSSPSECQPPSPSRYMRRLPPPPGFYLSKEHNYAQLCPLLWRRRYDQIVDCLEKALRQLHATRRRENRLRSTMLRLRDKQLRHTLSQDGSRSNGSWASGGVSRGVRGASHVEDSEIEVNTDDVSPFEERCVDHIDSKCSFLPRANMSLNEENRYCFRCGRERVKSAGQGAKRLSKTHKGIWLMEHEMIPLKSKDISEVQGNELQNSLNISDFKITDSHVAVQSPTPQELTPAGMLMSTTFKKGVQCVGNQELQVPEMYEDQSWAMSPKDQPYQQQQLLWVQDSREEQVILLPVSVEVDLQNFHTTESQAVLVSGGHTSGGSGEIKDISCRVLPEDETSRVAEQPHNSAAVQSKEDVRDKLKEHLEGFHLHLSSEFIN